MTPEEIREKYPTVEGETAAQIAELNELLRTYLIPTGLDLHAIALLMGERRPPKGQRPVMYAHKKT